MDNQLLKTPLKIMWNAYKKHVRGVIIPNNNDALKDISYWRNELFCNIITYMIPITFIAFVLGECMSVIDGTYFMAIFDLVMYTLLIVIAVNRRLTLLARKIIFISCLYCLSIALIYFLSGSGAGVLCMLTLTVITTIIFSLEAAYYSVLANLIICVIFGLLIHFGFNSTIFNNYTLGFLIVVLSNLITLSLLCAVCLNMLIKGLETTIAERKKAEEEVKKLNEELEQTVIKRTTQLQKSLKEISDYKYALDESSIVAIIDEKGIVKEVNNNFCTISKYNREELIGQHLFMLNPEHHTKEFMQDVWVTISSGKIWRGEVNKIAKDGTFYWLDSTIVPFLNESGIPYQYMVIRIDITQRKDAEDKLQEVNKELESFSYSVSHDLRAPLRALSGYSQMLNEDYSPILDEEGKRMIDAIKYNAAKMGTLIDNLLAFSKLGRKDVQKKEIDMNALAEGVLFDLNKSTVHRAEIKIGKLHKVTADYGLLHQVLFNLISNAVKYSSKKENPLVEISSEEKNGEIIFSVKDNGAGFDMQYADKLFGVFQRLHSQEDFEGTGVGLAIVQRIIAKHNGRVWAEGKVNEGAVFDFSLTKN